MAEVQYKMDFVYDNCGHYRVELHSPNCDESRWTVDTRIPDTVPNCGLWTRHYANTYLDALKEVITIINDKPEFYRRKRRSPKCTFCVYD